MNIPPFISDNKQVIAAVVAGVFALTAAYIRRDKRPERTRRNKPVLRLLLFPLVYLLLGAGLLAGEFFSFNINTEGDLNLTNPDPGSLLCLFGLMFVIAGVVWLPVNVLRLMFWPKPTEPEPAITGELFDSSDSGSAVRYPHRPASPPPAPPRRKPASGFLLTAVVWLLAIGAGTAAAPYYGKLVVKDRADASADMQKLDGDFEKEWDEALDACADTPSVDAFVKRAPALYQMQYADHLKKKDEMLAKKHPRTNLAYDSFSGYCVFRSREFQAKLAEQNIRIHLIDDQADYDKRIKTLQSGETPLAVFTVDALINNSAQFDAPPAKVVMVIDESVGADAMVSYKDALPDLDSLKAKDLKIVLVPNSPSETLARLVGADFNLPRLKEGFVEAKDAQDVYDRFKKTAPGDHTAFVLWEPYVSQLLREYPQAHKLIDSADPKCKDYITDVLVVQKEFLENNRDDVENIVKDYLEAAYAHQQTPEGMTKLVQVDSTRLVAAKKMAKDLTYPEAEQVVKGIHWNNTKDNFAHFGLADSGASGAEPLEETIKKITTVLVKTKAIGRPVKESLLVDKEVCAKLQKENFDETKGYQVAVPVVTFDPTKDWDKLQPVAGVDRDPISFRTGSFELSSDATEQLQEVAKSLKSLTDYYLEIQGSPRGANAADKDLAQKRAEAVQTWLRDEGRVDDKRMRVKVAAAAGDGKVTFVFLKPPH